MPITTMGFTPTTGLSDTTYSPETPTSESAIRGQFQGISNQLRDYINNTLIPQIVASNVPNSAIAGMTSLYVQDALAELKTQINNAVAGVVPDNSIADAKFSVNNKSTPKYIVTANIGNAYSVAVTGLTALTDGFPLCVKFNVASTGAITINPTSLGNYAVVDYFGNAVTNVRANLIANLRYDSVNGNFQLLGKGGGGNLIASDLLLNKTATGDSGPVIGTLSLTGTLGIGDAANGKTFYNTDAKTIQTGNGANISRKASGSGTTNGTNHAIVTGLSFTPSFISIKWLSNYDAIYDSAFSTTNASDYSGIRTGLYPITVSAGGFDCTTAVAGTAFTWKAYE